MTPDEALAALDELRAAREAGEAAVKATPDAVKAALAAGNTAAEVARRIGMSEGYVRKFRREAGLQDKRYAHLKPPAATPEPAPHAPAMREPEPWAGSSTLRPALAVPSERELPTRYRELPQPFVGDAVKRIARGYPTWHEETRAAVAGAPLLFQDLLEIKRAHEAQILDELGIELP